MEWNDTLVIEHKFTLINCCNSDESEHLHPLMRYCDNSLLLSGARVKHDIYSMEFCGPRLCLWLDMDYIIYILKLAFEECGTVCGMYSAPIYTNNCQRVHFNNKDRLS